MLELVLSPDTPEQDLFFHNCEEETSQILSFLQRRVLAPLPPSEDVGLALIFGSQKAVLRRLLLHAAGILPNLSRRRVEMVWLPAYAEESYLEVGRKIHAHLAERWAETHQGARSSNLARVLSFELSQLERTSDYVRSNLLPLLSIYPTCHLVLVLDLLDYPANDDDALANIFDMLDNLRRQASRIDVDVVVLAHPRQRSALGRTAGAKCIHVPPLPPNAISYLNPQERMRDGASVAEPKLMEGAADPTALAAMPEHAVEAMRFLHPLVALHQPASEVVLTCLPGIADPELGSIWEQIKSYYLSPTKGNGWSVTREGFDGYHSLQRNKIKPGSVYADNIPNAAKLYALQRPESFFRLDSPVEDVQRYLQERGRLVDHCAAGIAAAVQKIEHSGEMLATLKDFAGRDRNAFRDTSIREGKIVLCYLSQLLLTERYGLGREVFDILEVLTYGYRDFLHLSSSDDDSAKLASAGWVKNLGYVYDKNPNLSSGVINKYLSGKRTKFAADAVKILAEIAPDTLETRANVVYHTGWENYDAGDEQSAIKLFLDFSASIIDGTTHLPAGVLHQEFAFELTVQACVFGAVDPDDSRLCKVLDAMLARYGLFLTPAEVLRLMAFGTPVWVPNAPRSSAFSGTQAMIVFSVYDLATALAMASHLCFAQGIAVKLVPCRDKEASAEDIEAVIINGPKYRYLVGGPATPHGIGRLVSKLLRPVNRLYQIEQIARHPMHTEVAPLGAKLFSGRGICATLDAWFSYLLESGYDPAKGAKMLEAVILESFLFPILCKARDKVADLAINSLIDMVRNRAGSGGSAAGQEDIEILRSSLKQVATRATAVGASGTTPTGSLAAISLSSLHDKRVSTAFVQGLQAHSLPAFVSALGHRVNALQLTADDIASVSTMGLELCRYIELNAPAGALNLVAATSDFRTNFLEIGNGAEVVGNRYRRGGALDQGRLNELTDRLIRALHEFGRFGEEIFATTDS